MSMYLHLSDIKKLHFSNCKCRIYGDYFFTALEELLKEIYSSPNISKVNSLKKIDNGYIPSDKELRPLIEKALSNMSVKYDYSSTQDKVEIARRKSTIAKVKELLQAVDGKYTIISPKKPNEIIYFIEQYFSNNPDSKISTCSIKYNYNGSLSYFPAIFLSDGITHIHLLFGRPTSKRLFNMELSTLNLTHNDINFINALEFDLINNHKNEQYKNELMGQCITSNLNLFDTEDIYNIKGRYKK